MKEKHIIGEQFLDIKSVSAVLSAKKHLQLSEESAKNIRQCRQFLEEKIAQDDKPHYGINTGFGALCNVQIPDSDLEQLQLNLIQSHAAGMGDPVPQEVVRIMLLLKIQSLSYGHSGVRLELVERLIELYNRGILPVIYQLGSLGASGDLAPLAHLSLPLAGLGEVYYNEQKLPASDVLQEIGIRPLQLQSKEGLALLNGTQFSCAYAVYCLIQAHHLYAKANRIAAMSIDAFDCHLSPFDARLHAIRPHKGQQVTAAAIRELLAGSEIAQREKAHVQDPYAFRCVPQVHGATYDAIAYVTQVVETEMNAVTDNPNIFPESGAILSGGNFHAQPLALVLDFLAIALAELGSISERRVYQLLSGQRDLPAFLTPNPGLHSGFMIPQYTAAAIVSQNKQLCTPASVDSIVSCNGQEDHVSMAANAATKAYQVVQNVERLLAIEQMVAAQALEFRTPLRSSPAIMKMLAAYREVVPQLEEDRILYDDMRAVIKQQFPI